MDTQTPVLPVAPPEAPKKRNPWPWIGGVVIVLALIAAFAPKDQPATGTTAAPVADAPACVDVDRAISLNTDAQDELNGGVSDLESFDISGGAAHLDNAADDFDAIAVIFTDYPTVSGPASDAGTNMRRSASELRQMNVDSATNYLESATSNIDDVTDATDVLVGDIVPC